MIKFKRSSEIRNEEDRTTISNNPVLSQIISKTFNWKFENLDIYDDNKLIGHITFSIIGKKLVSSPHLSYGNFYLDKQYSKVNILNALLSKYKLEKFEVRSFYPFGNYTNDDKITSFLTLETTSELMMQKFKSKLRSQIKKGYKNKLVSKIGGIELLENFYNVYSTNMHQLGSPVISKKFFFNLFQFYENGNINIFLVLTDDNIVIGASILIEYQGFSEVTWASTLREYNYLSTNMFLYWEMISFCIENEYKTFSFGRSSKNSNTSKFKQQWGIVEHQLYWNYSEEQKINIKKLTFLSTIWKKLPKVLVDIIGPIVTKNIY